MPTDVQLMKARLNGILGILSKTPPCQKKELAGADLVRDFNKLLAR